MGILAGTGFHSDSSRIGVLDIGPDDAHPIMRVYIGSQGGGAQTMTIGAFLAEAEEQGVPAGEILRTLLDGDPYFENVYDYEGCYWTHDPKVLRAQLEAFDAQVGHNSMCPARIGGECLCPRTVVAQVLRDSEDE